MLTPRGGLERGATTAIHGRNDLECHFADRVHEAPNRVVLAASLALTLALAAPGSARAQAGGASPAGATPPSASQEQLARDLFIRGDIAYQEGRYQAAIDLFREAYRLSPRPLLLYNMANAQERLGALRDAITSLEAYLPQAGAESATVEARIGALRQRAADAERVEHDRAEQERVQRERLERERLERERLERERQAQLATATNARGVSVPGLVLTLVGGAAAVTGLVFDGVALSESTSAQAGCVDTTDGRKLCPATAQPGLQSAQRDALVADITLASGVVLLGVGIAVLVADRPGHPAAPPPVRAGTASVSVSPRPGGGMVHLGFSF